MRTATACTLFAFLFVCAAPLAQTQTPDTANAWRYLPLEVGNVWKLAGEFDGEAYYERREVTADTTIEGTRYFRYESQETDAEGDASGPYFVNYLRFDTLSTEVQLLGDEEFPATGLIADSPMGADFGSSITCNGFCDTGVSGAYNRSIDIGGDEVTTSVKTFDTESCEVIGSFAADIGLTGYVTMYGHIDLHYARIDDIEYGTFFPVAAEDTAPLEATVALSVFPNPVGGSVRLQFGLDRPQRMTLTVYDMLGRRVLATDLGPQPGGEASHRLDMAGLPAGLYVVRLIGDAGARATARIVRQ